MPSPLVRRLGRVAAGVGISILVLVVTVVALLQVPAVATWAANRLLTLVPLSSGYALDVGRVSGNWLTDLSLHELTLRRDSRELARIERVDADYDLRQLRGPDRRLRALVVEGGTIAARRTREGWDIARAFQTSGDTAGGGGDLIVDRLTISGLDIAAHLAPDSVARAEDLALRGRDLVVGDTVLLTMDSLGAEIAPPGDPALWFSLAAAGAATPEVFRLDPLRISSHRSDIAGRAVVPRSFDDPRMAERLDVRLEARPLALADLASIYPDVPPGGELQLDVGASARGRLVTAQLAARLDQATIELEGGTVVGRGAPAVYRVSGEVRELDPSRLHRAAPMGNLTGDIEADLRGETLALADGSASVRLRNSRIGETDLRGLHLRADVKQGRADLTARGQVFGGTVRVTGWARPFDSVPSYRLAGGAVGLEGTDRVAGTLAGDSGAPVLDLRFGIAGDGIAPREADVEGKLGLTAVRQSGERIDLGDAAVSLEEGRLELRPNLLVAGGTVRGIAIARLEDTVTYEVREGRIVGVDLGRLLGDTVVAPLTGRFSLAGQGLTPEEARANATLELEELRYAARRVERVIARARVAGGRAVLDLRGLLQGGRLAVEATTRPFDSVTTFEIRRASLDSVDLGTFLGRPDLAGPVSLTGSGGGRWGEAVKAVEATFTVAPSRVGTIQVTSGSAGAEMTGERLTWTAGLRTSGGSLSLSGVGRPLAEVPAYEVREGRADSIDLGVLLGRDSLTTDLDARFSGSLTGSALDSMLARLEVELLPSSVNRAELGPGRLALELDRGRLGGTLRIQGGDAVVAADLTGDVGGDQSRLRAEGDVRVERLARWTGEPAADGRLEGRFGLDLVADSSGLVTAGGSVTAVGGVGDVRLQQLHLALRPTPGMIHVDTLVVRSNSVILDGGGRIAMRPGGSSPAPATFRVTGRTGDVTPLALLAGADSVVLDSTLLDLTLTGPPERRKIEGTADVFRLLYSGTLAERVTARGSGVIDSNGMGAIAGRLRVEGAAAGDVSVRQIDVTGRYDSLLALEGTVTVSDDIGLALALRGTTNGDTTRAELRRLEVAEGGRTWRLQRPSRVVLRPRVVEVDGFTLGAGDRHLSVDGTFDRRDTSDMTMRVEGFDLDALAEARLVPVAGTLDGTLRLSGPATAPSVEGKLSLDLRRSGGEDVGRIESEVAWSRTGLRVDAVASHGDSGRLTVAGTLPWRFTLVPEDTAATVELARAPVDTMSLAVRADSFDLAMFEPFLPEEAAQELTGGLAVDAHIGGTPDQPRATGTLDVRRLGLTLPTLGVTYSEGRLAGRLSGERLTIDTLRLSTDDDQELLASGAVLLEPITDPTLNISARLEDFVVSDSDELRAVATGQVQLAGTAAKPVLTGDLRLEEAEIFTGGETAAAVEEVELTPADLQQLAQHFGPGALDAADEGAGFLERFRMNIDLSFARRVWFRKAESPSIDIELSGRINLRQTPGQEMQFFGQVEPIPRRGELNLYGRSFEVVEGTIALQGPVEEIALDVTAQYRVPTQGDPDDEDVIISVQATGNPDSLDLDFSSEPSMPQEDMISYIVTGSPASDNLLADQQGGGVNATDLALNQLAENLGGAAGEELGFDVFTIRQEPERGLTLTAGRYITSRIFVSLQQPLRIGVTSDEHLTGATGPGFELEYAWRRWLRSTLRGGSLPTSLLMRGRYAF
ncbi:MAG TPA: translocation/assembly module TamB domain-containing protein [Gemmatimonadales bacterium]|nr:translocation/assembly module TamB domain-containing protein [Gemmatimonadales bacterium]